MDQEQSCSYLPPEILPDILSRIPIKAVLTCKCVCKSWLDLLESPEFARSHLSKSAHGLLIQHFSYRTKKNTLKIFEFEDSLEVERHEHHYRTLLELDISKIFNLYDELGTRVRGSANGLLFLGNRNGHYYVCNPFTRQYIKLPVPEGIVLSRIPYGFGVSRLSNQYKVVGIHLECAPVRDPNTGSLLRIQKPAWQVYTLGTKSWRSITTPSGMLLDYSFSNVATLLNGNLHWLAKDSTGSLWISCFDLENEAFTKFRAPKVEPPPRGWWYALAIGVLRDRLCLFENSSKNEISIYMMNEYGDGDRSWSKEYVMSNSAVKTVVYAVKAFADGDLLMVSSEYYPKIRYYSNRTKAIELVDDGTLNADSTADVKAILYTPSFISLKEYETENVKVFEFFYLS